VSKGVCAQEANNSTDAIKNVKNKFVFFIFDPLGENSKFDILIRMQIIIPQQIFQVNYL
jgi:hypothetical protein